MLKNKAVVITAVFFLLDLISKWFFKARISVDHVPSGIISLVYHKNYGIIANFEIPQWAIITVSIIFILVIAKLLNKEIKKRADLQVFLLSILLAGAFGNLWDRMINGYVFDWLLLFERSVINLADIFIVIGIAGYLILTRRVEKSLQT